MPAIVSSHPIPSAEDQTACWHDLLHANQLKRFCVAFCNAQHAIIDVVQNFFPIANNKIPCGQVPSKGYDVYFVIFKMSKFVPYIYIYT